MTRAPSLLTATALLLLSLAGCGQTGPLYLPEPTQAPQEDKQEQDQKAQQAP